MFADRSSRPVLGVIVICTLPHFAFLSPLVTVLCLSMWIYAGIAAVYAWRLPAGTIMKVIAALFFIIAMTTHEGFTIEAFVALLALMAGLKLLEIRTVRDRMITVILGYFLIAGGLFFNDSIGATVYMLLAIFFTTAVLAGINGSVRGMAPCLRISAVLMLQAMPVMLVLFLLFPRVQGGIWGRTHVNTARTGFDDRMDFGYIAELARSNEVAFRVEFEDLIPSREHLYWRGAVLWQFDGRSWQRGMDYQGVFSPRPGDGPKTAYTITLEPHNEHWLFSLDLPLDIDLPSTRLLGDYSIYRWRPITSRVVYRVVSEMGASSHFLSNFYEQKALQLPAKGNPRSRAMAEAWFAKAADAEDYVQRVLTFFRQQPFVYTLQPTPLLDDASGGAADMIDRFLFESRSGFCEHYAASFVFLMRAAGLPARIVVGYQGGTRNQYGDYLVVRQSDAHAWSEVWLDEKGWTRVDPTSVVTPDRITGAATAALLGGDAAGVLFFMRTGPLGQWLSNMGGIWDYWNTYWNRWVMTYTANEQAGLFSRLGMNMEAGKETAKILLFALMATVLIIVAISVFIFREVKPDQDEIAEAWAMFCGKMSRIGVSRSPGQGPVAYLEKIIAARPDLTGQARKIVSGYVRLRYGNNAGARHLEALQERVAGFSPAKEKK